MHEEDLVDSKVKLSTWKKIISVVFKTPKYVIGLAFCAVALAILDATMPLLDRYVIEVFIENKEFQTIPQFVSIYILVIIGFGFTVFGFIRLAGVVEVNTSYILRKEAYNNLQRLPFSYYDKTAHGWLMARMTSDSRKLAEIVSWGVVDAVWSIFSMTVFLIIMIIVNPLLAVVMIIAIPIMLLLAVAFRKVILKTHRTSRKFNSEVTAKFNESFHGAKTTKSLNIEKDNSIEFAGLTGKLKRASIRAVISSAVFSSVLLFVCYIAVAFMMYVGGNMNINNIVVLGKSMDGPTLALFITYTIRFFDPIAQLSITLANFQQAQASAERVIGLIEEKPELDDTLEVKEKYGDIFSDKVENWEEIKGDVEFLNVDFAYKEGEQILKNFNLKIKAGSNVALVGHTGSGKTTIVNLIARFYEPQKGSILIDGVDYRERSIHWLHKKLGYVLQSPHLFSTTILENIRYGRLGASDQEVIEAARIIGAEEFIMKLPDGFNSHVGEGGNLLSIGQKQLISFARAIIANPRIIILDEATSSIDSEAEEKIQSATTQILKDRTSFVVAHRLSTIVNADLIIMMEMGKIIEMGSHKELLDLRGAYFELYKNQFLQEREAELFESI